MGDSTQVRALLEEVLNSGRSPEEVCAAHTGFLDEVRSRWRHIRALAGDIERVFPSSAGGLPPGARGVFGETKALPHIPGYQLEAVIGHGGMGVVYRARHIKLDRVVAVKMLRTGDHASARELAGLVREAQSIAALKHPHIVQVHDFGELDGRPYFTMELLEGGNLARKLGGKPLPAREAAGLAVTLAEAVQAAHRGGIVHRDLKPANVLLSADGTPKVTDFGLARRTQGDPGNTLSPAAAGTPNYMAPEQALGTPEAFGPSVDVYALGALLYELLTGRPPFSAESNAATQRRVISEDPVPPSRIVPKVPRDLEIICLKCLHKQIARRYATAQHLADDLSRFLRSEPIHARPVGIPERAAKWVRRHPTHAAAWAVAMAVLGAVLSAALWTASQRAAIERAVSEDLTHAVGQERSSDWRGARNTLERAKARLAASSDPARVASRAAQIERELDLVDRLGELRLQRAASQDIELARVRAKWSPLYREAFSGAGLLRDGDTPEAFAAHIASSPARSALIDALDEWTVSATTTEELEWLLMSVRLADPDPQWRDRARDRATWRDPEALAALARDASVQRQPVPLLLTVAGRLLDDNPDEAESLLRGVQAAHPSDFWASFALADALDARKNPDAIGFYRAAIAIRPEAAIAHVNLAVFLATSGRREEAVASMLRAAALDPRSFVAHHNLAVWLIKLGRPDEALEHARIATEVDPDRPVARRVLGEVLMRLGRPAEAAEAFRRGLDLSVGNDKMQASLRQALSEAEAAALPPSDP